ncbi:MAG: MBL fold metallo-hydrolase, partial [Halomonas sp.]|nr:MBL fold metallo-hydrolase [Halomonas sp.]
MPYNPFRHAVMPMTSVTSGDSFEVLPDVAGLTVQIVNVYFVGEPGHDDWVLVDAGMPHARDIIASAAQQRFGDVSRPSAIVLTHGHFDHVGSVVELADYWDVPVYAHPRELPYLTGERHYPDPDTRAEGGLLAKLSGVFPTTPVDLRPRIQPLPEDGSVPGM